MLCVYSSGPHHLFILKPTVSYLNLETLSSCTPQPCPHVVQPWNVLQTI